jgi:hypothetical protein
MKIRSTFRLVRLVKIWRRLSTVCTVLAILLFVEVLPASASLSMDYRVTDGYFSPASGSGNESLSGSFTIKPGGLTGMLPDGSISYPNPPSYLYDSLNLQTENRTITMVSGAYAAALARAPAVVMVHGLVTPHFENDQSILTMSTVTLDLTILEHGFDQGREYWRYSERMLVPVDQGNPSSNRLFYDDSGNYYPRGMHFTYELRDNVDKVMQAVYPPGMLGPGYIGITESTTSIGTLAFDATPVPIPAGVWLLGSGLIGLAGLRRKDWRKGNEHTAQLAGCTWY